ncbi:hypothetical protein BDN72DRAFT_904805 [Pluteus cervinus]|uniref:Uncharacterized protein n=1 Tax=Pluteus cervinus TaxID=181527 RepID=A0ACD3A4J5_9AGAR|nr:hypothetical protein BDN72DRAFT_904805 [Pluteus cervinus]
MALRVYWRSNYRATTISGSLQQKNLPQSNPTDLSTHHLNYGDASSIHPLLHHYHRLFHDAVAGIDPTHTAETVQCFRSVFAAALQVGAARDVNSHHRFIQTSGAQDRASQAGGAFLDAMQWFLGHVNCRPNLHTPLAASLATQNSPFWPNKTSTAPNHGSRPVTPPPNMEAGPRNPLLMSALGGAGAIAPPPCNGNWKALPPQTSFKTHIWIMCCRTAGIYTCRSGSATGEETLSHHDTATAQW